MSRHCSGIRGGWREQDVRSLGFALPLPPRQQDGQLKAMAGCNCDKVTFRNLTPPRCSLVALLLLAALAVATAVAQQTPQPVFTDLFTYRASQLLGKAPDAGLGDYDI